jgi:hypothetical protein
MQHKTLSSCWAEDLAALPPPDWLIEGVIPEQGFAALYSAPGVGKTFLALDWALRVASGQSFAGRSVKQGPVVYVIGEGGRGFGKRLKAWSAVNGELPREHVLAVREPVQLHRGEGDILIQSIDARNMKPRLIILDTLNQCFSGGDENSAKDMGLWVQAVAPLQQRYEAAVLVLHHLTKNSGDVRGSGALPGALDAMIRLSASDAGTITVKCEKQKDAEPFTPFSFRLSPVPEADSACVELTDTRAVIPPTALRMLEVLSEHPDGLSSGQWQAFVGLPETTFHRHRRVLVRSSLVTDGEDGLYRSLPQQVICAGTTMPLPRGLAA